MNFKKFNSIENHYREKYLDFMTKLGFNQMAWLVFEKIHGANFSFITDGKTVKVASRTSIVDGTFYNCQSVIDKYSDTIMQMKNEVYPGADQIQVYGELYGLGVQSGIYYGGEKDFRVFDIAVDGLALNPYTMMGMCANYELAHAPFIGVYPNLEEALAVSPVFQSRIAETDKENFAEGLVMQPLVVSFTPNGSRVMIKHKHPKFAEKIKGNKGDRVVTENPFTEVASDYVNQNRLDAVLSKEGELNQEDFGRIIKLMCEDVLEDMIKDEEIPADWKSQDEYKLAGKGVARVVSAFLKENLLHKL